MYKSGCFTFKLGRSNLVLVHEICSCSNKIALLNGVPHESPIAIPVSTVRTPLAKQVIPSPEDTTVTMVQQQYNNHSGEQIGGYQNKTILKILKQVLQ